MWGAIAHQLENTMPSFDQIVEYSEEWGLTFEQAEEDLMLAALEAEETEGGE